MFRAIGFLLAACPAIGWCQRPVIFPGGVVNAANYASAPDTLYPSANGLAGGSIASIFGTSLASTTQIAQGFPWPVTLGGASVTVYGIPVHLFYVSPGQIDFQVPSPSSFPPGVGDGVLIAQGLVVSTSVGSSDPYLMDPVPAFGIFTTDASGCGQGAVLNVDSSGGTSVNSSSNSVSPGEFISIYGTGLGLAYNAPPDGSPAPSSPLASVAGGTGGTVFDLDVAPTSFTGYWAGRAPGLVGVDQVNIQVPDDVREGCAVPLQNASDSMSQPVTIAISKGGGPCADPPSAGYGQIMWEKTITTSPNSSGVNSVTESDAVTVSLQASPGKQVPVSPVYTQGYEIPQWTYFGPACPVPGYRSLNAGPITVQGLGLAPVNATAVPLPGPIRGLAQYQATLPAGSVQPGSFTVTGGGGSDVGAFQSGVEIGQGIQITTPLAGMTFVSSSSSPADPTTYYTIKWTGGDPNSLVTVYFLRHNGYADNSISAQARASDGSITMIPVTVSNDAGSPDEVVIEVTPDPSQIPALSVPGLSLGGLHTWKYSYHFGGILVI